MRTPLYKTPKDIRERPDFSSVDCQPSKISIVVDQYLRIHAALPCYIQGTRDFTNKLETNKDKLKDSIQITLDVQSPYTNIPNHESIEAVKETFYNKNNRSIATRVIIKFLYLVLTLNNFIFNDINYLQIKDCAMGRKSN